MTRVATPIPALPSERPLRLLEPRRDDWVVETPREQPASPPSPSSARRRMPAIAAGLALVCAALALAGAGYLFHRLQGTETQLQQTHGRLTRLEQRVQDTRQSIRFVHDLVILCSYDRHICLNGVGKPSLVVAGILRRAGLNPSRIPKTD